MVIDASSTTQRAAYTPAPPLRILIITGIFPPDIGGPATYVPRIAHFLAARTHIVTIVTLSDVVQHADDHSYPFRLVRLTRQLPKPLRWLGTIAQIIALGRNADLLFVNGLQLESTLANVLLGKPLVQKVVGDLAWERARSRGWLTDTFEAFQQRRYGWQVELLRRLRAWWTCQADQVIVPSSYLAQQVQNWGVANQQTSVIYNGVTLPSDSAPINLPISTPITVISVARLVPWKHLDSVIRAVAQLERVGLVLVGDGPERNRLEALAATLGITDRVYLAGACSGAHTFALMRASDLFVLNSSYEGLPHVVIEAMHAGLAIVATAVGGTPEVIQDGQTGRLIPPLNDAALFQAIADLAYAPAARQWLAANALQSVERFSYQQMLEATAVLLEQTVQEKQQP